MCSGSILCTDLVKAVHNKQKGRNPEYKRPWECGNEITTILQTNSRSLARAKSVKDVLGVLGDHLPINCPVGL